MTTPDPYLGQRTLMRAILDATLPPGTAWHPSPGGDFDHLLDGIGDDLQTVFDFLSGLDDIRNPRTTPYLDDLERDFGLTPNTGLTDAQRRMTLLLVKYQRNHRGTINDLQTALDRSGLGAGGYGLTVYANDPPVDPSTFIGGTFRTYLGSTTAYLGYFSGAGIPAADWKASAFNGTTWCMVGTGVCATSTDGQNFTMQAIGSGNWTGVCWTGTVWIAVSSDGQCKTGNAAGSAWTTRTIPSGAWNSVIWTGAKAVAVGAGPTNYCATSPDGPTAWTAQAIGAGNWNALAYNASNLLCAVGNNILGGTGCATSADAITWNSQTISGGDWRSVAYSSALTRWAAVSASGASGVSHWTGFSAYSSNAGVTWSTATGSAGDWHSITLHPAGRFVAIGAGTAMSSEDGITYALRTIPNAPWASASLNGSTLLAVAPNGNALANTTDGITWTAVGASGVYFGTLVGGGSWIVNGDFSVVTPNYEGLGGSQSYLNYTRLGSPGGFLMGEYYTSSYLPMVIASPADSWSWPLVFFLAGGVTRDGGGHVTSMSKAQIPGNMRQTLIEIVLRWKPLHTWGLLMADFY